MQTIEGVVASAATGEDRSTIVVFPILHDSGRRVAPEAAVELSVAREAWQTGAAHRDHVLHLVGAPHLIRYDGERRVETIRAA